MARPTIYQPKPEDYSVPTADNNTSRRVRFTAEQCAFLEKLFPEQELTHQTTEAHMRHYLGQRSVIHAVRRCVTR